MNFANNMPKKERISVYVDGFNLYFGIVSFALFCTINSPV